ncbi:MULTISPECIES: PqqD family protein [Sphingobacterium]|uniref:PqqD family protein n=1 Tax=Sphingobacterium TaxID=28453 RepID=UPI0022448FA8|nr:MULTISPECIES: PqqD family protein [Sphingobacterium]MCW8309688.1 PqqD family protein [Sphingobacterium sp. InxBP1]
MKLRSDLQLRKLGDKNILVDPNKNREDTDRIFTFNETAVQVWLELQGKEFNVESITAFLLDNYEVEEHIAERDAKELIKQFGTQGFLI